MHPQSIIVIGSSNTDMVIKTEKFPLPGETLLGGEFFMFPGGKGANQAVAAARLGGNVTFITKIGNDIFGKQALQQFINEGIRTDLIIDDSEHPSGVALITVDAKGENTIVVAQGSNGVLTTQDLSKIKTEIEQHDILLMQLEIPMSTVLYAAQTASQQNKKVILNPAPAALLPDEIYKTLFLITPNESEAEIISGTKISNDESIKRVAQKIKDRGVKNVIITLGSRGVYVLTNVEEKFIPAPIVKAIDTTAAGDVFNGALTVAIAEGQSLSDAVIFANQAAAISVTKMGAQASAPFRKEISKETTSH
ncbi:MAG: ribokinase [Chryseolinea sp.]